MAVEEAAGLLAEYNLSFFPYYPTHKQRLNLFAQKGEKASKYFKIASFVGAKSGIHVTFEEVLLGSDNIGADVLHGTDVFGLSLTAVTKPRMETGSDLVSGGNARNAQRPQKRRKKESRAARYTYTGDKLPLLWSEMNALFVREVKSKGYLPRELPDINASPKGSSERDLEIGLKKVETFDGMCKDVCRHFMQKAVIEGNDSEAVAKFNHLFSTQKKEKSVRMLSKKREGEKLSNGGIGSARPVGR